MELVKAIILFALLVAATANAQDSAQDYLDAHNRARAMVGVGPLTWDDQVAAFAQDYARQREGDCMLIHSGDNSNTCAPNKVCGHYTQVVWRNSIRLGCAKVTCDNGGTFIDCNYDPPGNYNGQKPY